jgi:VanZ family protein
LAIIYGAMLVYASLMPFDFASNVNFAGEFARLWRIWPVSIPARVSGSDVASNLALYFPLGYILVLRLHISRAGIFTSIIISTIICSALSAGIETLQFSLISRTSSASDWLLNSFSGCAGAVAGAICGIAFWNAIVEWIQTAWRNMPVDIATLVFAGLLAADALSPFLPTILIKQVWQNLKRAQLNPWDAFMLHPWHWWFVTRVATYGVLTMLLAAWGGRVRPTFIVWIKAAFGVLGFAVCLEVGKVMIVSRTFSIANIASSVLGCGIAIIIGRHLAGKISARLKVELACAAILFYVLYLAWTPFDFVWILDISKRLDFSPVKWLPFYSYAMGSELNHVRLFVQTVFLMGIFVYLLRLRFPLFEWHRSGLLTSVFLSALLGAIAESGQIFLISRWPSMTDVYCFALGGVLGACVKRPSSHQIVNSSEFSH